MSSDKSSLQFPKEFFFGSSVAPFQVEDNISGKRQTDWDTFIEHRPTQIIRPGEIGPSWWNNEKNVYSDLSLMAKKGLQMQRLGIEWARIEPEEGTFDKNAIAYYRRVIDTCKKLNLTPMVTINHFSLPLWISRKGGWENSKTTDSFTHYVNLLIEHFGDIHYWIIVNEPSFVLKLGYLLGIFPPGKRSPLALLRARKTLLESHKKAYALLKKHLPTTEVGSAFQFLWLRKLDDNSLSEKLLAQALNYLINNNYVDAVKDSMDFLGINYYTGYYVDLRLRNLSVTMRNEASYIPYQLPFSKTVKPKTYVNDMGWPVVPDFFFDMLRHTYDRFKKPIIITENGIADRDDIYRSFYTLTHLVALWAAIEDGVDIRGYIHWSSIDNLEWVEGYAKRFGLIGIDPQTGKRTDRKGADIYEVIVKERNIDIEKLIQKYIPNEEKTQAKLVIDTLLASTKDHCPRSDYAMAN